MKLGKISDKYKAFGLQSGSMIHIVIWPRVPLEKQYFLDCPFTVEQILDEDFEGLELSGDRILIL